MCGIVGIKFIGIPNPAAVPFIEALLVQSQMRGRHATGIAFVADETNDEEVVRTYVDVVKQPKPAEGFIMTNEWYNIMREGLPPVAAILHTRYSTSGDWAVEENNQPLKLGDLALVHNGLVSMAEKATFEQQYSVKCATANDSEILLRKIVGRGEPTLQDRIFEAMKEVSAVEPPIHACGLLNAEGEVFCWCDNIRPLYRFTVGELEGFCSTQDIFVRACGKAGVVGKVWRCTPGSVYTLQTNWHE